MNKEDAEALRKMMVLAVRENDNSKARTKKISVGAKTSTAQTGRYNKKGEELCHAWITGFFPARKPKYAVTVLIENGGYGNDAAAPVFRRIAERIADLENEK
jgi:penicillin-binding protein 2